MSRLRKYGVQATMLFPLIGRDEVDFENTPVIHAVGDSQISKNETAFVNTTLAFAHAGNGIYVLILTPTEMETKRMTLTIIDQSSPKEWEDQCILIETYGNALAQHEFDLDSDLVTAIFGKTGITEGGSWTFSKIIKVLAAWATGKWQDKSGSPGTYEVLDAEDGTTKILEVTPSETSPQKDITVS